MKEAGRCKKGEIMRRIRDKTNKLRKQSLDTTSGPKDYAPRANFKLRTQNVKIDKKELQRHLLKNRTPEQIAWWMDRKLVDVKKAIEQISKTQIDYKV